MADDILGDALQRFGPFENRGDRELVFKLHGRDPGELGGLRELGPLRIEADQLIVTLNKASREVVKLQRAASKAAATMKSGTRAARASSLRSKQSAASVRFTGESLAAGPVLIGRSGPSVNQTYLRNAAGHAFTASIAAHIGAQAVNAFGDLLESGRKMREAEGSNARLDIIKQTGASLRKRAELAVLEYAGVKGLSTAIAKLLSGRSQEDADLAYNRLMSSVYDTAEQQAANKETRALMQIQAIMAVRDFVARVWENINTALPQNVTLRSRREVGQFRRQMSDRNRPLMRVLERELVRDGKEKAARAADKAGIP